MGYRVVVLSRPLITQVGKVQLRVPSRIARGRFSTNAFEHHQRSEKALLATLVEMCARGLYSQGQAGH